MSKDLKPFEEMEYHPLTEEIIDTLMMTTQSSDRQLFRVMLILSLIHI